MKLDAKLIWDLRSHGLALRLNMLRRIEDEPLQDLVRRWVQASELLDAVDKELFDRAKAEGWTDDSPPVEEE